MPNLRVISDNAIDRAVLSASSTAGNFNLASLQSPRKSDVWRAAAGATARLGATWATAEPIQAVALPFCDLSPTATMRVRVTSEAQATNLLSSTGDLTAAAWTKGNVTVSAGPTDPSGGTAAFIVTAGATAARQLKQTLGAQASAVYTNSVWMRRRNGAGNVNLWSPDGLVPLAISNMPAAWTRYSVSNSSAGTVAAMLIELAVAGDAIDIAFPQLEAGAGTTSYYPGTRPLGYIDSWQSYAYDSGNVLACPAPAIKLRGFTAAQSASAYAFGGGAHARHWLPASVSATGLAVDIVDASNLTGSIEASFLVAGPYWESATNFDYGASAQLIDSSKNDRNDAGDLISDAGTVSQHLSIPMSKLAPADRTALWNILRASGIRYPLFASMFPGDTDLARERDHQVFGKLVQLPAMSLPFFNIASASLEIESV